MQSFMTDTSTRPASANLSSAQGHTDTTTTAAQLTAAQQYGSDLVQQHPVQQQHAQIEPSMQQYHSSIDTVNAPGAAQIGFGSACETK